jgi:single-strand DNA-binding protein
MADTFVSLTGTLGGDPEIRFTPNGSAVANFSLAVTPRVKDGDNWRDGETSWFRVNVWRDQAEHVADSLAKGQRVMVTGRLKTRSWETPEGQKRTVTEIEADEVGPSLRWATAKVEKASGGGPRSGGDQTAPSSKGQFRDEAPF